MSKKKKAAIVTEIIGSVALVGGIGGTIAGIIEAETKSEKENEEEKTKKKSTGTIGKQSPNINNKKQLSEIIKNKELNLIIMKDIVPTKKELLNAIKINNKSSAKNLTEDFFNFQGSPTETQATIIGVNPYKGKIVLTYKKDNRIDLSEIIKNKNLGTISTNSASIPTVDIIKTELSKKGVDKSQINIENITDTSATVKSINNSAKYKGIYKIKYSLINKFLIINYDDNTNFKTSFNSILLPKITAKYYANTFNLTSKFGYKDWSDFINDYKYFQPKNDIIRFYRNDDIGEVFEIKNCFTKYELSKAINYNGDISKNNKNTKIIISTGIDTTSGFEIAGSLEYPWTPSGSWSVNIFDKTITNQLTSAWTKVNVALQTYESNHFLMLRVVYQVKIFSVGTTSEIINEIYSGDYGQFFN